MGKSLFPVRKSPSNPYHGDELSRLTANPLTDNRLILRVNQRFFYGWVMTMVGGLALFASGPAQSYTFSVYMESLGNALDLSRTSVSSAYGLATLAAAFLLPAMGRLVDKYGARVMTMVVGVLMGLSAMGFGSVNGLITLGIGFGLLRFFGQGSLMLCANYLVAHWFTKKRGFALSLMTVGFSLSFACYPPLARWLMIQVGWRQSWLWLGALTLILLVPTALLIRDKPEDLDLQPDGDGPDPAPAEGHGPVAGDSATEGLSLSEAVRTPVFWIVSVSQGVISMLVTGMVLHQFSILSEQGLDSGVIAGVYPMTAVAMVCSMPVMGWLLDRVPTHYMMALGQLLYVVAMVLMVNVNSVASVVVFSMVFGTAQGGMLTNGNFVWPTYFGRKHMGSIQGVAKTIGIFGSSVGPVPLGLAFDLFGRYQEAMLALAILPAVLTIAVLFARSPMKNA